MPKLGDDCEKCKVRRSNILVEVHITSKRQGQFPYTKYMIFLTLRLPLQRDEKHVVLKHKQNLFVIV